MSQFIALLTREHHEHKNAFFWAPIVILALVLLAGGSIAPQIANLRLDVSSERHVDDDGSVIERQQWRRSSADDDADFNDLDPDAGHTAAMGVIGLDVAGRTDQELRSRLQPALRAIAVPFIWVLIIVSLFGCIACMHDERKDRSILFWKSMPVSDAHTVISKYVYLAWLAPLVTIAAILLAQLFSLTLLSTLVEEGMGGRVWSNSGMFTQALQLVFGFVLNGVNLTADIRLVYSGISLVQFSPLRLGTGGAVLAWRLRGDCAEYVLYQIYGRFPRPAADVFPH